MVAVVGRLHRLHRRQVRRAALVLVDVGEHARLDDVGRDVPLDPLERTRGLVARERLLRHCGGGGEPVEGVAQLVAPDHGVVERRDRGEERLDRVAGVGLARCRGRAVLLGGQQVQVDQRTVAAAVARHDAGVVAGAERERRALDPVRQLRDLRHDLTQEDGGFPESLVGLAQRVHPVDFFSDFFHVLALLVGVLGQNFA